MLTCFVDFLSHSILTLFANFHPPCVDTKLICFPRPQLFVANRSQWKVDSFLMMMLVYLHSTNFNVILMHNITDCIQFYLLTQRGLM